METTTTTVFVGGGAPVYVGNASTDLIKFYGTGSGGAQMAHLTALTVPTTAGFASTAAAAAAVEAINALLAYVVATGQMAA